MWATMVALACRVGGVVAAGASSLLSESADRFRFDSDSPALTWVKAWLDSRSDRSLLNDMLFQCIRTALARAPDA
jgi:hypothetical protein